MISGKDLLAGPYGREFCAGIAMGAAPGDHWNRPTDAEHLAALRAVRQEQVAALDERRFLAELETVVGSAVYWQAPDDGREQLARPEVVEALLPIADAVAAHPATMWWSAPFERRCQFRTRYWSEGWDPELVAVDRRPALRRWRETTGRDGRWWLPDWPAVAEDFDAVHVTVVGYLATAGWAVPTADGATVLAGWGPGRTCWLRPDRLAYTDVVEQWHRTRPAEVDGASTWRRVPSEGPDGAVELRVVDNDDTSVDTVALLTEATRLNVNWAGTERVGDSDIAADPALAHYTQLWPERGDFSLVAEVSGRIVGVVWLLFLDSGDTGYGFIAGGVPELSVCVWPGYRGVGIGGLLLLDAAFLAARQKGVRRMSLSVENGDPAKRLYRAKGFFNASGAAPGTMVVGLRP